MAPSMSGPLSYVPTGHPFYFIKVPLGSAAGHQITYLHTNQYLAIVHSTRPMLRIPCRNTETLVWLCEAVILLGLVQESLVQYDNYDGMPPAESTSPHYASN